MIGSIDTAKLSVTMTDTESVTALDERIDTANDINDIYVKYWMQDFMNKMYSSTDECPFSVTDKQEW